MSAHFHEIIGLIPAAGKATRLPNLTCSKEIVPVGLVKSDDGKLSRPRVACEYLLAHFKTADISKAFLIIREGKWDIPACLGNGTAFGLNLGYLLMTRPYGPPFTLDEAYPFVQHATVALGFPDIIFESSDAFTRLITRHRETGADVVLGLFPTEQPEHVDMVDVDGNFIVREIVIKPHRTALRYTWAIAVWSPAFTYFMHEYLLKAQMEFESHSNNKRELHVGDVIQAAIESGMRVVSVKVADEPYIDIGIPENLEKIRAMSKGEILKN